MVITRISMYNMSAACRKQMHSIDYLKKIYIYMHILFCTAAKHLFGIKMCTPVSIVLSLNITVDLHCLLNIFSRNLCFSKLIRGARQQFCLPFHKTSYPSEMPRVLRDKNRELVRVGINKWKLTPDPFFTHWPSYGFGKHTKKEEKESWERFLFG